MLHNCKGFSLDTNWRWYKEFVWKFQYWQKSDKKNLGKYYETKFEV